MFVPFFKLLVEEQTILTVHFGFLSHYYLDLKVIVIFLFRNTLAT